MHHQSMQKGTIRPKHAKERNTLHEHPMPDLFPLNEISQVSHTRNKRTQTPFVKIYIILSQE